MLPPAGMGHAGRARRGAGSPANACTGMTAAMHHCQGWAPLAFPQPWCCTATLGSPSKAEQGGGYPETRQGWVYGPWSANRCSARGVCGCACGRSCCNPSPQAFGKQNNHNSGPLLPPSPLQAPPPCSTPCKSQPGLLDCSHGPRRALGPSPCCPPSHTTNSRPLPNPSPDSL